MFPQRLGLFKQLLEPCLCVKWQPFLPIFGIQNSKRIIICKYLNCS